MLRPAYTIALILGGLTSAEITARAQPPASTALIGRPIVIFVHGRDQFAKESAALTNEWFNAFRTGLQGAGLGSLMEPSDYSLVTYQLLYRGDTSPRCPADDIRRAARLTPLNAAKEERMMAWGATSTTLRDLGYPSVGEASGTTPRWERLGVTAEVRELMDRHDTEADAAYVAELEVTAAEASLEAEEAKADFSFRLATLAAWDKFREVLAVALADERLVQRALRQFVLQDTERYLTRRPYRCATNATLDQALQNAKAGGRPVILVAHSMGTLVAYDLLYSLDRGNPGGYRARLHDVRRFVSMGTQLGIEGFMREFAGFPPKFSVPSSIATWVNIRGADDYVSPARVSGLYEDLPRNGFSEYFIPTTVGSPHDISGYLSNVGTAQAVAFGWCQAFSAQTRPAACKSVKDLRVGGASLTR